MISSSFYIYIFLLDIVKYELKVNVYDNCLKVDVYDNCTCILFVNEIVYIVFNV